MKGKGRARGARVVLELVPPERLNIVVDGVYAIVMTLLVLELRPPAASSMQEGLQRLQGLEPKAVAFVIGFVVAASGWAYVHQVGLLFKRSNLIHEVINLLALMFASLIPFGASIMGSFPHTFYGPATYSLIVGVLTLIYALDLALCQRALIPPVVDRRLIWTIFGLAMAAGLWCLFVGLVIAPWHPAVALWALGLHLLAHWTCMFGAQRRVRQAANAAERWNAG